MDTKTIERDGKAISVYLFKEIKNKYINGEFRVSSHTFIEKFNPEHFFIKEIKNDEWCIHESGKLAITKSWFDEYMVSGKLLDRYMGTYLQGICEITDNTYLKKKHMGKLLFKFGCSRNVIERCEFHHKQILKNVENCNAINIKFYFSAEKDEYAAETTFKKWLEKKGLLLKPCDFAKGCCEYLKKNTELIAVSISELVLISKKISKINKQN